MAMNAMIFFPYIFSFSKQIPTCLFYYLTGTFCQIPLYVLDSIVENMAYWLVICLFYILDLNYEKELLKGQLISHERDEVPG